MHRPPVLISPEQLESRAAYDRTMRAHDRLLTERRDSWDADTQAAADALLARASVQFNATVALGGGRF